LASVRLRFDACRSRTTAPTVDSSEPIFVTLSTSSVLSCSRKNSCSLTLSNSSALSWLACAMLLAFSCDRRFSALRLASDCVNCAL
jgi:hypothetical protein